MKKVYLVEQGFVKYIFTDLEDAKRYSLYLDEIANDPLKRASVYILEVNKNVEGLMRGDDI